MLQPESPQDFQKLLQRRRKNLQHDQSKVCGEAGSKPVRFGEKIKFRSPLLSSENASNRFVLHVLQWSIHSTDLKACNWLSKHAKRHSKTNYYRPYSENSKGSHFWCHEVWHKVFDTSHLGVFDDVKNFVTHFVTILGDSG